MGYEHLRDTTPKARKVHYCYLCGEPIPVGELHVHRVNAGEGNIDSTRMHIECEAETHDWHYFDWEEFFQGDMPRPAKQHGKVE